MIDKTSPFRAIVEQVEVQYDVDPYTGKPLTIFMDTLACGHKIKSAYRRDKTHIEGERPLMALQNRRCKACYNKEQSS